MYRTAELPALPLVAALSLCWLAGAGTAAAGDVHLVSRWRPPSGQAAQQPAARRVVRVPSGADFAMALSNDARTLHVTVRIARDGDRMAVLRRGLVLWFDPANQHDKAFGVEFPVPPAPPDHQRPGARHRHEHGSPSTHREHLSPEARAAQIAREEARFDPDAMLAHLRKTGGLKHVAVLRETVTNRRVLSTGEDTGLRVQVQDRNGVMTWRLALPLARDAAHPYAVGAGPGAEIGIGLEVPARRLSKRSKRERGAFDNGGDEGYGNDGDGDELNGDGSLFGGGGFGGRGGAKGMHAWVTARLATGPR